MPSDLIWCQATAQIDKHHRCYLRDIAEVMQCYKLQLCTGIRYHLETQLPTAFHNELNLRHCQNLPQKLLNKKWFCFMASKTVSVSICRELLCHNGPPLTASFFLRRQHPLLAALMSDAVFTPMPLKASSFEPFVTTTLIGYRLTYLDDIRAVLSKTIVVDTVGVHLT